MDYKMNWFQFWSDVRAARGRLRLSQKKAGARYGVGGSAFGQWERKNRAMLGGKFLDMCYCFDLNPYAYYTLKEQPGWKQEKLIDVPHEPQPWPDGVEVPGWVNGEYFADDNPDGFDVSDEGEILDQALDGDYSEQMNEDFLDDMGAY